MADEFLDIFQYLQRRRKTITLVNVYKGLPVISNVQVLHVGSDSIIVKPDKDQLVCLYGERQVFIRYEIFPRLVLAKVEEIDLISREVTLFDFAYTGPGIGNRKHLRVKPDEPIISILQTLEVGEMISGDMADLSREGLAVYINQPHFPAVFVEIGTQVKAVLRLPVSQMAPSQHTGEKPTSGVQRIESPDVDNLTELGLIGVVVNAQVEEAHGWHRIGLRLAPRHAANEVLLRFIKQRQTEIIRELKIIYQELVREQ